MKKVIAVAIVALMVLVTAPPAQADLNRQERMLIHKTNVLRDRHGLPALHKRHRLHRVALHEVKRMINCLCLTHTIQPPCGTWGQNIGLGVTVKSIFRGFKRSTPHRANLLDGRFHRIGVAARRARGEWWVAMEFCH